MTRLTTTAIVALVLLRLLVGWHFYNEGVKKLDPSFSSEVFLRGAKGPFAPMFASMAPGYYDIYELLPVPAEYGSDGGAADAWYADYGKRAAAAAKAGEPMPTDIDPAAAGADWVERVSSGWRRGVERVAAEAPDAEALDAVLDARVGDLVHFVYAEGDAIEELRHEAWRLQQLKVRVGDMPAPFQRDQIADSERDIARTMWPWVDAAKLIEQNLVSDLTAATGLSEDAVADAMAERSLLRWIDVAVAGVVLGSGICIFLGFATRLASLLAAGFLFSLILTLPPWLPDADLAPFFTWSIELAALLVLAAVGAGRWVGLDGVLAPIGRRFGLFLAHQREAREQLAGGAVS